MPVRRLASIVVLAVALAPWTSTASAQVKAPAQLPLAETAVAGDVEVQFDPATDFARYRTFAWAPFLEPVNSAQNHRLLVTSVERELMAKGLVVATQGPADLLVNYWAKVDKKVTTRTQDAPSPWNTTQTIVAIDLDREKLGTLSVELYDARSNIIVWRAKLSEALSSSRRAQEQIEQAVTKLLSKYPK